MSDEPTIEYTVRELILYMSNKVDKLADELKLYAQRMDTRVSALETQQVSEHSLSEFKAQVAANANKTRMGIYGLAISFLIGLFDLILHFFKGH